MEDLKFGTDGIRGVYGERLTEETAYRLGAALGGEGEVLIGRDNRPSSPALARAVAEGVIAAGGRAQAVGLTTTPALFFLTQRSDAAYGVMVTASHNPPAHNGLKVFTREGKPSAALRRRIEEGMARAPVGAASSTPYREDPAMLEPYRDFFRRRVGRLDGMRAVVDFAGGAGYAFRGLLEDLGVKLTPLSLRESGDRINESCGALHPALSAAETRRIGADLGFALDGDGDRIIASDRRGEILDGDRILYLLACRMKKRGTLTRNKAVMTVMTNGGVVKSLSEKGIEVISCAVGDSAVAEAMKSEGLNLGGEQSGHIILGDHLMTGDALLVGALLLKSIREEGPLEETPRPTIYPQVRRDLPVRDNSLAVHPAIVSLASALKESLGEGRVLVRASGTENLIRIMTEHPDEDIARRSAERLRRAIQELDDSRR